MAVLDSVLQEGVLVDRKWLSKHGIKATAVDYYLRSSKIENVVHGLYRKPGPPLKWQQVVYSLTLLGHDVHVGHETALAYHGYEHYLKLAGSTRIRLYSKQPLPSWVEQVNINPGFVTIKRNLFSDNSIGIVQVPFGTWDWPIRYATAERAFIEFVSTIELKEEILQAVVMMEGAANLRPNLLQGLLEACENIKTKRLFLWLARSVEHSWYHHIDISRINLGKGKRQIVQGGVLDDQFLITVPKKDKHGHQESLF